MGLRPPLLALTLACAACAATPPPPAVAPSPTPPAPAATTAPAPAPPAPAADPLAAKVDPLFSDFAKPGSPGCAVGVYRAGTLVFSRGYGFANLEYDLPIAHDTVFELASVSKQFTALAVLLLAQDGKISLDDDVRKYVPELPVYGKPITLKHLLFHTSGLRDYAGLLGLSGFDEADVTNDDDVLYIVSHQRALNAPTGTEFSYTNTGYFLLSLVVKRASGKTLAQFAKERIFDPLGMTSSLFLDDHQRIAPRRATGYAPRPSGGFQIVMSNSEPVGAPGVHSTIDDLAKWDANFYDAKVGGRAVIDLLRTPGKLDDGKPITYAMGLDVEKMPNGLVREDHGGARAGYRTGITRFHEKKLTVAVLCNTTAAETDDLTAGVLAAVDPSLAPPPPPGPSAPGAPATASSAEAPSPSAVPAAALAPALGAYYDPVTLDVRRISLDKGKLRLDFGLADVGFHRDLEALDPRTFIVLGVPRATSTHYHFEPAAGGKPAHLMRLPNEGKPTALVRFEPFTPTPAQLADYAGRYHSDELLQDMQIGLKDGKLVTGVWGRSLGADPLTPLARDAFKIGGAGFTFERDARGKLRGFTFGADRMWGIKWVKREEGPAKAK